MSGGSKTQSQSTQTNTVNPLEMAMYQANYANAQNNANALTRGYTGQLTAGFTPAQLQAQQQLTGVATNPQYLNMLSAAGDGLSNILANPVNGAVTPQPVSGAQLSGANLSPYLNPYTSDVIDTSLAELGRQQAQAQVAANQQATAAKAFGGSRSGVENALTNQYYNQQAQNLIAGLNQSNYSQAQNAALSDIAARNNAAQFNASQNMNAQNQSVQNALAAQGMGLNAANALSGLGTSAFNLASGQGSLLGAVGNQQQQQNQAALTNAYQAWLQNQQNTATAQNLLNSSLGLIPVQQTVNNSGTSNTTTNPGLVGILNSVANVIGAVKGR